MKTTVRSLTGAALLLVLAPWTAVCVRADEEKSAANSYVKVAAELGRSAARGIRPFDRPTKAPVTSGGQEEHA
jgi:hypothetical protein